ncbi:MAG TPA: isocitrate/isopropylmalate family dehydrogenase, partial [Stellaceae bacterium]|nr:isocitrate/isopropylmalate family dehydrogenase [Stellaceae bacterium]
MREHRIAAIPGDGIGKEVIAAGLEVLRTLERRDGGFRLAVEHFPWGSDYFRAHGELMPKDGVATLHR